MDNNYEIELKKIQKDYEKDLELAFKESERIHNEISKKLGHNNFLANSINNPLIECTRKYQEKFKELRKKYNKQNNNL